ncbi:hypothetical protein C8R44DRAFT_792145 [Mycena epipterygia]|nr:hypothetical protein C8R44DRAFT_792145 [Mycena epipterygia]
MLPSSALFFALFLPFALAQTTTTTVDAAGETVVEIISTDVNGLPSTSIISTVVPGVAVTQTVTTTDAAGETVVEVITGDGQGNTATQTIQTITPVAQPVGPVGQPGPTDGTAGAPTPYTYTTTDAAGDTIPVVATFTPSFATTVMPSLTFKATVLDYSVYTASYVTAQVATGGNSNSNGARQQSAAWWAPCVSVLTGMIGGMVLLLGA